MELNQTHDPARRSWLSDANNATTDFPIQNLPFGVFRTAGRARGGVAIGDHIVDLGAGLEAGLFADAAAEAARAASGPSLNRLMAMGQGPASALRARLSDLLRDDYPERGRIEALVRRVLVPTAQAELLMPAQVGQFTDFLNSSFHTGRIAGNDEQGNPKVPPAFKWLPIAYNSRASSVVVSGTPIRRPNGQWRDAGAQPRFGPEPNLDFELELGLWIGPGNELGHPIPIAQAGSHIFGFCLLNDWSARGIQFWESVLGPFLGKSMGTTVSPWVVTAEAMLPFRCAAFQHAAGDPAPLPYLYSQDEQAQGGYDLEMEALIETAAMRARHIAPARICLSNFRYMYWTLGQILTHHASNGCNLGPGDLLGSGTCSGPAIEQAACLLEKTLRGTRPWTLPDGEQRVYLEDDDEVIFRARASRPGYVTIGFGECRGRILPALA